MHKAILAPTFVGELLITKSEHRLYLYTISHILKKISILGCYPLNFLLKMSSGAKVVKASSLSVLIISINHLVYFQ